MGKTYIILTNNNLKFVIHNILLFPVVLKGISRLEQSDSKIKRGSLYFFKKLMSCLNFPKIKNVDIVLHE